MANMALRAARRAGQILTRAMDRLDGIDVREKSRHDLVSELDRMSEHAVAEILHKSYPEHGIHGEESGVLVEARGPATWIIDPLDGTTNYLHGIPHFCVSIALLLHERLEVGVIFDPLRNEAFTAARGQGAQLNGRRLRVTGREFLDQSVLATGLPPGRIDAHLPAWLAMQGAFMPECRGIRRNGSAALDLAWVAAGRFDGFFEIGLAPWDVAAGALLVLEAGGLVTDLAGNADFMRTGHILAASPKIHRAMRATLEPLLTPPLR